MNLGFSLKMNGGVFNTDLCSLRYLFDLSRCVSQIRGIRDTPLQLVQRE